jgi:hypothetical protein
MVMRDIPREEWDTFLDGFSREHRDEPVTVAKNDMRDGLRFAERATPLMGISHDRERISITVEESPSGEVTHTIRHPESVAIEEPGEADEDPRVAVHLMGGGEHLVVRVDREPMPR